MNNLLLLIINLLYVVDVILVGNFFLTIFKLKFDNKFENKIVDFAIGNIFYALLFIYLGIFHLLYEQIILVFYLFPVVFFLIRSLKQTGFKRNLFDLIKNRKIRIKELFLLLLIIFLLIPLFPYLFSFSTGWDVIAYHLVLPKIYLIDHQLSFYPWLVQTTFPFGIESIFALGELVSDSRIGNFIIFDFLVSIILFIVYALRSIFKLKILILSIIILLIRRIIYSEVTFNPYIDIPLSFYSLLSSIYLYKYFLKNNFNYLILAVCFAFFTILIKFTGWIIVLSLLLPVSIYFIVKNIIGNKKKSFTIKPLYYLLILIIIFPILFILVKNFFYTQNPFYPYLNNIFQGLSFDIKNYELMISDLRSQNLKFEMVSAILLRLQLSDLSKMILVESLMAFTLILFTILSVFERDTKIRIIAIWSLLFYFLIILFVGFPSPRYAFPMVPIMVIITARKIFLIISKRKFYQIPLILLFIFSLIIQIIFSVKITYHFFSISYLNAITSMLSLEKARDALSLQDNWPIIDYVNNHLNPKKDKILILFDNRLYYYKIPFIYAEPSISPFFINQKNFDIDSAYIELKSEKITYLVINRNWGIPGKLNKLLFEDFINKNTILVVEYPGQAIYKIK